MRKFFARTLLVVVCTFFAAMVILQAAAAMTAPNIARLPPLKNGDIVFQTNLDLQSVAVMLASGTAYTHIGIIKIRDDGSPVVVEVGPVRETPLLPFIRRGVGERLAIMRMKNLKPEEAQKALGWAKTQYGKPYDFYFLPDRKQFYCSELVEDSFAEGAGISLGKYQKVGELKKSAAMEKIIKDRWQSYPPCRGDRTMTFGRCYKIIMEQELITPAAIAADPRMEVIYSNYP